MMNAVNWTRARARANRTTCLWPEQNALEARCATTARARRSRVRGKVRIAGPDDVVEVAHVNRRAGTCIATQRVMPFQRPAKGSVSCASVGAEPDHVTMSRYLSNHGHQAELIVPILDDAVLKGEAPAVLHWHWRRTHWITQVLRAMLPFTRLDTATRRAHCHTYKPLGSGGGGRTGSARRAPRSTCTRRCCGTAACASGPWQSTPRRSVS